MSTAHSLPSHTLPSQSLPSLYLPHGGGPAFFMEGEMRSLFQPMADHLAALPATLPTPPRGILVISAHWEERVPTLTGGAAPDLIYDYGGFPPETYELTFPAPGSPHLADRAAGLLGDAGIEHLVDPAHGWDHGVFIPLKVMFPRADVPVVALSLQVGLDPLTHLDVGAALAPLRNEGVLIVGSGMSFHNMSRIFNGADESSRFEEWLERALSGDRSHRRQSLVDWASAPSGRAAHPRAEHLLPLMVAAGAGGDGPGQRIWQGSVGTTVVSSWAFA